MGRGCIGHTQQAHAWAWGWWMSEWLCVGGAAGGGGAALYRLARRAASTGPAGRLRPQAAGRRRLISPARGTFRAPLRGPDVGNDNAVGRAAAAAGEGQWRSPEEWEGQREELRKAQEALRLCREDLARKAKLLASVKADRVTQEVPAPAAARRPPSPPPVARAAAAACKSG